MLLGSAHSLVISPSLLSRCIQPLLTCAPLLSRCIQPLLTCADALGSSLTTQSWLPLLQFLFPYFPLSYLFPAASLCSFGTKSPMSIGLREYEKNIVNVLLVHLHVCLQVSFHPRNSSLPHSHQHNLGRHFQAEVCPSQTGSTNSLTSAFANIY